MAASARVRLAYEDPAPGRDGRHAGPDHRLAGLVELEAGDLAAVRHCGLERRRDGGVVGLGGAGWQDALAVVHAGGCLRRLHRLGARPVEHVLAGQLVDDHADGARHGRRQQGEGQHQPPAQRSHARTSL